MEELLKGMRILAEEELARARAKHGETFRDFPVAWHALAEELQEAAEDYERANTLAGCILRSYRLCASVQPVYMRQLAESAMHAAAELVQVAAVARKMLESEGIYAASSDPVREGLS